VKARMQQPNPLRAISQRLNTTPVEDLPRVLGFLVSTLSTCSLDPPPSSDAKSSDDSVIIHRLRTRISALLQERRPEGRFAAAVLIKAIVDGARTDDISSNVFSSCESWAKGLLGCLNKPDALELKKVYLVAVTRIFLLAGQNPSVAREITTPLLPAFISVSLSLVKPVPVRREKQRETTVINPLLEPVLRCWRKLLPEHPSVFRPFVNRIRPICASLLADGTSPHAIRQVAIQLASCLHLCAAKNSGPDEWSQTVSNIIQTAHDTVSILFRSVVEEWEPHDRSTHGDVGRSDFAKPGQQAGPDPLGLGSWTGIDEGSNRLATVLSLLEAFISSSNSQSVSVPIGAILDLTARILGVTVPPNASSAKHSLKMNPQADRDEREELWMHLPQIHISCVRLLKCTIMAFGGAVLPVYEIVGSQALDVLESESWHDGLRCSVYELVQRLLELNHSAALLFDRAAFHTCLAHSLEDLRPVPRSGDQETAPGPGKSQKLTEKSSWTPDSKSGAAAWKLLPLILAHASTLSIPRSLRAEADRLAILLNHNEAMLASVMNPPPRPDTSIPPPASILPFLARAATDRLEVEALLRPRMPLVQRAQREQSDRAGLSTSASSHFKDSENDADTDLLSRLEHSLDEGEGPRAGSANPQFQNDEAVNESTSRKRPFDIMDGVKSDTAPEMRDGELDTTKRRARAENTSSLTVPVADLDRDTNELTTADHLDAPDVVTAIAETSNAAPQTTPLAARPDTGSQMSVIEDTDSSDFEIPKIDPGFDTDEDEVEDDDDAPSQQ